MALHLTSKAAGDTRAYEWAPRLADGDSIDTYTLTPTTVTVSGAKNEGDRVTFKVAGGVAGTTYPIAASAVTDLGETLVETLYIPVIASAAQIAATARDYVNFALRKITGNGVDPDSAELDDALERLNALVAAWRAGGADIGAPFPITANSVIYCPDWAVSALRFNLRVSCHDHYDAPITAFDANEARRGLQLIKHMGLPADREGADFF